MSHRVRDRHAEAAKIYNDARRAHGIRSAERSRITDEINIRRRLAQISTDRQLAEQYDYDNNIPGTVEQNLAEVRRDMMHRLRHRHADYINPDEPTIDQLMNAQAYSDARTAMRLEESYRAQLIQERDDAQFAIQLDREIKDSQRAVRHERMVHVIEIPLEVVRLIRNMSLNEL
jgi:hypothetical protein